MDKPSRVRGGKQSRGYRSNSGITAEAASRRQQIRKEIHADAMRLVPHISNTARIPEAGVFCDGDGFSVREEYDPLRNKIVETYIPDQSLTAKLFLGILPQRPVETVLIIGRQLSHDTGCTHLKGACSCKAPRLVITTDEQVLSMSDRTLLRRGNPFTTPTDIHRQTSRSKRIRYNIDGDMVNRETVKQDRLEAGVDLDTFLAAAENSGKPRPTSKRTSGVLLGSKQRKAKSK